MKAKRAYERAARRLADATAKAFPVGSVVDVTLGNARITGKVLSAGGYWWSEPAQVRVQNLVTGKIRCFSATFEGHNAEIV